MYEIYRHWLIGGTITWRDGDREVVGMIQDLAIDGIMTVWTVEGSAVELRWDTLLSNE